MGKVELNGIFDYAQRNELEILWIVKVFSINRLKVQIAFVVGVGTLVKNFYIRNDFQKLSIYIYGNQIFIIEMMRKRNGTREF